MAKRRVSSSELGELRARLNRYKFDIPQLEAIRDQIDGDNRDPVLDLYLDVMAALQAARRRLKAPETPDQRFRAPVIPPDFSVVGEILEAAGVSATDGRPLYRYRVSDDSYSKLHTLLDRLHRRRELSTAADLTSAVFVLACSEWFRRAYDGGAYAWRSPAPDIIDALTHADRTKLAIAGLRWWGRPIKKTEHGELRLQSIVLEGGFPVKLLETRTHGHVSTHLRRLMTRLEVLKAAELEDAAALSQQAGVRLNAFNHEEFHYLCAELCLAILELKREGAMNVPVGLPISAWLDANHAGWRESLPIVLTDEGGNRLIDDLVNVALTDAKGDASCVRFLRKSDRGWVPGVSIGLSGPMRAPGGDFTAADGRLRLFAAGALAHSIAGEIGLIEPPTEEDPDWFCRPRGRDHRLANLPLDTPAQVQVRSADRAIDVIWPRGDAIRADVLTFVDPRGDAATGAPEQLQYLGSGSLRTRRDSVYVWMPLDHTVEPINGGPQVAPVWTGEAQLFELTASARVLPPSGPHYRIQLQSESELIERLRFRGAVPAGIRCSDPRFEVFAGAPELQGESNGRLSRIKPGEVVWKSVGGSPRDWCNDPPVRTFGVIEVTWKDPQSSASRDRRRIAILPAGAQIKVRGTGPASCEIETTGLDGWGLTAATDGDCSRDPSGLKFRVAYSGLPEATWLFEAQPPRGAPVQLTVRLRFTGGGFVGANGRRLTDGQRLMLEDLRGASAFAEGKAILFAQGSAAGSTSRQYRFEYDMPLWRLSEDIVRIFSESTDLDYTVRLELGGIAGRPLRIARYAATIAVANGTALLSDIAAPADTDVVCSLDWIAIASAERIPIAEKRWSEWMLQPRAALPDTLAGPGILVFREGRKMVARPTAYLGPAAVSGTDLCSVAVASLHPAFYARKAAQTEAVARLVETTDDAVSGRRYLINVYMALDRAPPSTVEVSSAIADNPKAQAALLCACLPGDERVQIWQLENQLPFLWAMVPVLDWRQALQNEGLHAIERFVAAGLKREAAQQYVGDSVEALASEIKQLDPILATPIDLALAIPAKGPPPGLAEPCSDRIRRIDADRHAVGGRTASLFREPGSQVAGLLPDLQRFDPSQWEGLDAPCVAAMAAAGKAQVSKAMINKIREIQAQEPLSFADIYAAALCQLWANTPLRL